MSFPVLLEGVTSFAPHTLRGVHFAVMREPAYTYNLIVKRM